MTDSSVAELTRGMRNNNPLNLTYVAGQPMVQGSDGRFGTYATPQDGIAAAVHQLQLYQTRAGAPLTVSQIVDKWAPASDGNNTGAYLQSIQKLAGLGPNDPVDVTDPAQAQALTSAMAVHESGAKLDPAVVGAGVKAGLAGSSGAGPGAGPGANVATLGVPPAGSVPRAASALGPFDPNALAPPSPSPLSNPLIALSLGQNLSAQSQFKYTPVDYDPWKGVSHV